MIEQRKMSTSDEPNDPGSSGETLKINLTAVERVLKRSSLVGLGEFRCPVAHPQFFGGGPQTCPYIVFARTSVRITRSNWRPEVCTPNVVSLYNVGETYARQAISSEGDQSDWIALSPDLLREIAEPYIGARAADGDHFFLEPFAPIDSKLYLAQRTLFRKALDAKNHETLALEENAIHLTDAILKSVHQFWRSRPISQARNRNSSERRRMAIANDSKAVLAEHYARTLSLPEIAGLVNCSAGYLCRTFKQQTGFTLHEYLQQLRLRFSLQMLSDSWMDLAGIAEQLGFANHSHFTSVFHRSFGITPSTFVQSRMQATSPKLSNRLQSVLAALPSEMAIA